MEFPSGEAGVLRTALGVVLNMDGIDARVRLYLWSGGVEDITLPVVDARRLPSGAQVVVMFLSDRPQSGMVMGTVEGNLSWRRTAPPAFADHLQPLLLETISQAKRLEPSVEVIEGLFPLGDDTSSPQFDGCVLMADGRVFFVPTGMGGNPPIHPQIWDPQTGAVHVVDWTAPVGTNFMGGVLLHDGRVFFQPHQFSSFQQAQIYDPSLDRITPAGEPICEGMCGSVVLHDGRVLLVPSIAAHPLLYDPQRDEMVPSAASIPEELFFDGGAYTGGVLLPDGRVLFVPNLATAAALYDPTTDSLTLIGQGMFSGEAYAGGVLLPDGRAFLVPFSQPQTCIFDPSTDSLTFSQGPEPPWTWRGGVLLPDGRVLLLPLMAGASSAATWDPETNSYEMVAELAPLERLGAGVFAGGVGLPDGRVVLCPMVTRDLVVWDPGCGVGLGRDICLSGFWNKL